MQLAQEEAAKVKRTARDGRRAEATFDEVLLVQIRTLVGAVLQR